MASLELAPPALNHYRLRGVVPGPEAYHRLLWSSVECQFMVHDSVSRTPAGVICCYSADYRNRRAKLAAIGAQSLGARLAMAEALILGVTYFFKVFDLEKLTAEVLDVNLPQFKRFLRSVITTEGVLREHAVVDSRRVDLHLLAMYRDTWDGDALMARMYDRSASPIGRDSLQE